MFATSLLSAQPLALDLAFGGTLPALFEGLVSVPVLAQIDVDIDGGGFAFGLLFGLICAVWGDSRGRSPVGWFVGGFLFHVFALILLAILPNRKDEKLRERVGADRDRRLRERMRHDRSVQDRRYEEIERRLRAHDVALGLDTVPSTPNARLTGSRPPELSEAQAFAGHGLREVGSGPERVWYFSNDSRNRSAAPAEQLRGLYQDGRIDGQTLVWTEGMHNWCSLNELPELESALRG